MRFSRGIVRKYPRQYTRTLKDGSKKKYSTEQVQVTIPKQSNIFKNGEEVLILPQDEESVLKQNSDYDDLEIANFLYVYENYKINEKYKLLKKNYNISQKKIKELTQEISKEKDDISEKRIENKDKLDIQVRLLNKELKTYRDIVEKYENENKKIIEENKTLIKNQNKINNDIKSNQKYENLLSAFNSNNAKKEEIINQLKNKYNELLEKNKKLNNEYDDLKNDYNILIDYYTNLENYVKKLKNKKLKNEFIINKLKEYILKD